nr:reverse transcriptase domain-containing protein [Tanacetum cinerariifolium]
MSESIERTSVFSRLGCDRSESPRHRPMSKERRDGGVFNMLGSKEKSVSAHLESYYQSSLLRKIELIPIKSYHEGTSSRRTKPLSESEDIRGGHWKSRSRKKKSSIKEDDLSQPWVCEETNPFTPRIRYFDFPGMHENLRIHARNYQPISSSKDQPKAAKKGEASGKNKPLAILMVQPWKKGSQAKVYTKLLPQSEKFVPTLRVTISILWDHRETRNQENPSNPINSSRNVKIPVPGGALTLRSSRIIPLECTMVSGQEARPSDVVRVAKEKIKLAIHPEHPEQAIAIGSTLTEEGRKALCELLRSNLDILSWKPEDITGNARATYQCLVDKAFQNKIGRNLEVYLDDLVIKSRMKHEIIRDIKETFKTLREINMKLNPKNAPLEWRKVCSWDTRTRTSIKGQILEDFIMERPKDNLLDAPMEAASGHVDTVHERIILLRWFWSWLDTYKFEGNRIHLRSEI